MTDKYILQGTTPVKEEDLLAWAQWFETANRQVVETWIPPDIRVSTVFLALDYQRDEGPPLLFETMVFGGACDQEQVRYSTWHEAEHGHEAMVLRVHEAERESGESA